MASIIPSKREMAFFNAAKAVSKLSDHEQTQIGCVVLIKHRIVSSGYNSCTKCHPLQKRLDEKRFGCECRGPVHAEVHALIPLIRQGYDLTGASIFVYREHKNGTLALSKPCEGCWSLIQACGIKKVFYTTEESYYMEKM